MPFKSEKQRKWMWANDPEMAKKWEKEEKMKQETKVRQLIRKMVRETMLQKMMTEKTIRLSTMKDANFEPGQFVQILGKKGKVKLDKKSVRKLAKIIRNLTGKHGMGWSFTEEKLNEATNVTLPNGVKVKIDFKGITLQQRGKKPVFLNRSEMMKFFQATSRYLREMREGGPGSGPQNGEDNPFDREPSDDELADIEKDLDEGFAGALKKGDRKNFDKIRQKQSEVLGYKLAGTPDIKTEIDDATKHSNSIDEAKKRDYKAEYKKFQSSPKMKKYRAELNKYNRDKGTYGNGDKKDASHKGGKIVGFEEQSKNRGRAEKSRLKKEGKLSEVRDIKISDLWKEYVKKYGKNKAAAKLMDVLTGGTYVAWDGDKIKNFKKQIIKKFSKYMREGKLTETKFYAFWNRKKHIINGKNLHDAKQKAILKLKVPKRKVGLLAVVNANEHDRGSFRFEGKLNEAKETIFDVAKRVMKDRQAYPYKSGRGKTLVDMQSANLLTKVFKKVNPKMKKILADLGYKNPAQLMNTLWAVARSA